MELSKAIALPSVAVFGIFIAAAAIQTDGYKHRADDAKIARTVHEIAGLYHEARQQVTAAETAPASKRQPANITVRASGKWYEVSASTFTDRYVARTENSDAIMALHPADSAYIVHPLPAYEDSEESGLAALCLSKNGDTRCTMAFEESIAP